MATKPRSRFRIMVLTAAILAIGFVAIQFIRPALPNPPVEAELQAPPEVMQILKTSCYNCHSNQTVLSWFDKPVPAYWLVVRDVKQGREHLNFSELGKLPINQQRGVLFESISQIELGAMPLPAYTRLHPESVITPEQLAVLRKYLSPSTSTAPAAALDIAAADAEHSKWIQSGNAAPTVAPSPNGIAFMPDYKNWRTISSTERFDNNTTREILGNDVAVKAIAENHINPWPDGTIFAKIAWTEQADESGAVRPGKFFQVEFMVRDSNKYADTLGWGWARWRGTDLKPYGKDKNFTSECVGCHHPLSNTDHVFTSPIRGQQ